MYLYLLHLNVPRLARYGRGEAIFQQMVALYIRIQDQTSCARIAAYVGSKLSDGTEAMDEEDVKQRARQIYKEVSGEGRHEITMDRLLAWMQNIGLVVDEDPEIATVFAHFDQDHNGVLDEQETTDLIEFLLKGISLVTSSLTLRTANLEALSMLANCDWNQFVGDGAGDKKARSSEASHGDSPQNLRSIFLQGRKRWHKSKKVHIRERSYRMIEAQLKVHRAGNLDMKKSLEVHATEAMLSVVCVPNASYGTMTSSTSFVSFIGKCYNIID